MVFPQEFDAINSDTLVIRAFRENDGIPCIIVSTDGGNAWNIVYEARSGGPGIATENIYFLPAIYGCTGIAKIMSQSRAFMTIILR